MLREGQLLPQLPQPGSVMVCPTLSWPASSPGYCRFSEPQCGQRSRTRTPFLSQGGEDQGNERKSLCNVKMQGTCPWSASGAGRRPVFKLCLGFSTFTHKTPRAVGPRLSKRWLREGGFPTRHRVCRGCARRQWPGGGGGGGEQLGLWSPAPTR